MKTKQLKSLVVSCALAVVLVFLMVRLVSAGPELGLAESQVDTAPPLSSAKSGLAASLPQAGGPTTVTLQAASGVTIAFHPNNNPDPVAQRDLDDVGSFLAGGGAPGGRSGGGAVRERLRGEQAVYERHEGAGMVVGEISVMEAARIVAREWGLVDVQQEVGR
jgi:hypothetical protein